MHKLAFLPVIYLNKMSQILVLKFITQFCNYYKFAYCL